MPISGGKSVPLWQLALLLGSWLKHLLQGFAVRDAAVRDRPAKFVRLSGLAVYNPLCPGDVRAKVHITSHELARGIGEMLFEARINEKQLAAFCRRVSTSLMAGLDTLGVVERELNSHASRDLKQQLRTIYDDLRHNGATFADAIDQTGSYFPPIFRKLVRVGEETGHLPETLRRLSENFETRIRMRRVMLTASFWPLIQLAGALFVISMLILVQGFLPADANGNEIDLLGFGLSGMSGFVIFWLIVAAIAAFLFVLMKAVARGMFWVRPLQLVLLKIPVVGTFLEAVSMGNLAWAMSLTFNTGLDVRTSIPLSIDATNNSLYMQATDEVVEMAVGGQSLYDAFAYTHVFPGEFLDVLRVGEDSGQLPEAMAKFSERCQETAEELLKRLAVIGGFIIWGIIICIILFFLFRLVMTTIFSYYQTVNELSQPGAF